MTYTEHTHLSQRTRITVERRHVDAGDNVTVLEYHARWDDGTYQIDGYGLTSEQAVTNLAEMIGDAFHKVAELGKADR